MFVILFLSYMAIFIYMMMLLTIPCIYMMARDAGHTLVTTHQHRNMMANAQVPGILASLRRTQYDPARFQHDSNCVICLNEYEKHDIVT